LKYTTKFGVLYLEIQNIFSTYLLLCYIQVTFTDSFLNTIYTHGTIYSWIFIWFW